MHFSSQCICCSSVFLFCVLLDQWHSCCHDILQQRAEAGPSAFPTGDGAFPWRAEGLAHLSTPTPSSFSWLNFPAPTEEKKKNHGDHPQVASSSLPQWLSVYQVRPSLWAWQCGRLFPWRSGAVQASSFPNCLHKQKQTQFSQTVEISVPISHPTPQQLPHWALGLTSTALVLEMDPGTNEIEWQCAENVLVRMGQSSPLPRKRCLNALENKCVLESEGRIVTGAHVFSLFLLWCEGCWCFSWHESYWETLFFVRQLLFSRPRPEER